MKLNVYILLFLLLCTSFGNAQNAISVFGNLYDMKTNESVDYANVACLKSDSTFLKGSISDSLGYFKFDLEGAPKQEYYILQITHLNYEKKFVNIRLSDNSEHTIKLEPNSNSLSEVLVLGTQTKVKNKLNVEYKVTDRLREKSLRTSQLLENIPTVFVDYNQNVYIKGSSRILILRNGKEIYLALSVSKYVPIDRSLLIRVTELSLYRICWPKNSTMALSFVPFSYS
jgi:hypothetical protein